MPILRDRKVDTYKHSYARQHPTTSPPTVFRHLFGNLMDKLTPSKFISNPIKKYQSYISKRRARIQNRRTQHEPSRFARPSYLYLPERYSNQDYRDSTLVDCRTNYAEDNWKCSKKFPRGHQRCCSTIRRNRRRNFG